MRIWPWLVLAATGCGGAVHPPPTLLLHWTGDGNPTLPVCPAAGQPCKSAIEVQDFSVFGAAPIALPLDSSGYQTAVRPADAWKVRTVGERPDGSELASPWE